jgi:hypothetical protein
MFLPQQFPICNTVGQKKFLLLSVIGSNNSFIIFNEWKLGRVSRSGSPTFERNISPPFSESKEKANNQSAEEV